MRNCYVTREIIISRLLFISFDVNQLIPIRGLPILATACALKAYCEFRLPWVRDTGCHMSRLLVTLFSHLHPIEELDLDQLRDEPSDHHFDDNVVN